MGVTIAQAPPIDNSGGIMHVRFMHNGRLEFIQRIHLNTNVDSAVVAAFNAYKAVVKEFYNSDWTIQLTALDQLDAGVPFRVPCPVAADQPGDASDATSGIASITETIFRFSTSVDSPEQSRLYARLRFVGIALSVPASQLQVSGSAGGTAADQALVALVTNSANHIVSHAGQTLLAPATKSTGLWKAERRRRMRKA